MKKPLFEVGYDKSEMDFGINCSITDLTKEQMNELRLMIIRAIGTMEDMWRRSRETKSFTQCKEIKEYLK